MQANVSFTAIVCYHGASQLGLGPPNGQWLVPRLICASTEPNTFRVDGTSKHSKPTYVIFINQLVILFSRH